MLQRRRYMVSIDFHTIIQRPVLLTSLKQYNASLLFSLLLLSIYFVFLRFMSKSRFTESPGHKSDSKLLTIFTERERESRRSPVVRGLVGWCDGAG